MNLLLVRLAIVASILAGNIGFAVADEKVAIYAAASMKDAVEELAEKYESQCGCVTSIIIGGSGTLARQIEAGAPADLFISADPRWIEWLQQNYEFNNQEPQWFATNQLVIISRPDLSPPVTRPVQLEALRFAIGEPHSVPAGAYAKEVLESVGLWRRVSKVAVRTENVRVALAMVNKGVVDAAIVYASDSTLSRNATITKIDPSLHRPIRYGAIAIGEPSEAARGFLIFLETESAKTIVKQHGFQPSTD